MRMTRKLYAKDKNETIFEQPYFYIAISTEASGHMSIEIEFGEGEQDKKIIDTDRSEKKDWNAKSSAQEEKVLTTESSNNLF